MGREEAYTLIIITSDNGANLAFAKYFNSNGRDIAGGSVGFAKEGCGCLEERIGVVR